jgi:ABC-type Fe3+/spermidine/putrescine transport system ATPase subunit
MIRLTVNDLRLTTDGLIFLDDINLEARPGAIHIITGRSGSGKSMLGRTLAGLEPDSDGEIYLDGRDMNAVPPDKRRIGWVASESALWPGYTVYANVEFGLKLRKISRSDRRTRVSEALGWFGVDSLRDQKVETLTPVEARRVALARALAVDPQMLVIDEPLGDLDDASREALRENIVRVQAEQRMTTLILTRHPSDWWAWADRITILDGGSVVQTGPMAEVYNRPVNPLAAEYLGLCNILSGEVEEANANGEIMLRMPFGKLLGKQSGRIRDARPGDRATVYIRPEAIGVGISSNSPQMNRVPVRINSIAFEGGLRRFQLDAQGDTRLVARSCLLSLGQLREGIGTSALIAPDYVGVVVEI